MAQHCSTFGCCLHRKSQSITDWKMLHRHSLTLVVSRPVPLRRLQPVVCSKSTLHADRSRTATSFECSCQSAINVLRRLQEAMGSGAVQRPPVRMPCSMRRNKVCKNRSWIESCRAELVTFLCTSYTVGLRSKRRSRVTTISCRPRQFFFSIYGDLGYLSAKINLGDFVV